MALTLAARVVLPGLWTECDDQGLFAWKPLTLKARLLPADNVNMTGILTELVEREFIQKFAHDGREFGAVRNFRKFQRPKKPNAVHFMPPELRTYVALSADGSPPVPHQTPTKEEKPPQMEDVGGRMKDEGGKDTSGVASRPPAVLGPEFIRLPTNRFESQGEEVVIYQPFVAEMQGLYPAVDVREQIRGMRAWLITNAEKRKTRTGMKRFINGWLSKAQDKGNTRETSNRGRGPSAHDKLFAAGASIINELFPENRPGEDSGDSADVIPIGRPLLSA